MGIESYAFFFFSNQEKTTYVNLHLKFSSLTNFSNRNRNVETDIFFTIAKNQTV